MGELSFAFLMTKDKTPYSALNVMQQAQSVNTGSDPDNTSEWEWSCSEEIKRVLVSMGVYDTMRGLVFVIETSKNKRDVDLAKSKMDAIGKMMSILKNATVVSDATGGGDDDDKISGIEITIKRQENGQEQQS